jgi:addiction module RelE/StbE family toxin
MSWSVRLNGDARRDLAELAREEDADVLEDVFSMIAELYEDHCPAGCIPLTNYPGYYRCRIAENYRMVYRVSEKQRRILITRIRPRGSVYKGL